MKDTLLRTLHSHIVFSCQPRERLTMADLMRDLDFKDKMFKNDIIQ